MGRKKIGTVQKENSECQSECKEECNVFSVTDVQTKEQMIKAGRVIVEIKTVNGQKTYFFKDDQKKEKEAV